LGGRRYVRGRAEAAPAEGVTSELAARGRRQSCRAATGRAAAHLWADQTIPRLWNPPRAFLGLPTLRGASAKSLVEPTVPADSDGGARRDISNPSRTDARGFGRPFRAAHSG